MFLYYRYLDMIGPSIFCLVQNKQSVQRWATVAEINGPNRLFSIIFPHIFMLCRMSADKEYRFQGIPLNLGPILAEGSQDHASKFFTNFQMQRTEALIGSLLNREKRRIKMVQPRSVTLIDPGSWPDKRCPLSAGPCSAHPVWF